MSNFDEKLRLCYALVQLREHKSELAKIKENHPTLIISNINVLQELYPLSFFGKETYDAINAACTNILDIIIAAIDRKFAELKAEFEALDKE